MISQAASQVNLPTQDLESKEKQRLFSAIPKNNHQSQSNLTQAAVHTKALFMNGR
jgi:hypothetical protein